MTQYVEMARHMAAYENGARILPATLERFFEGDPDAQGWDVFSTYSVYLQWGAKVMRFALNDVWATPYAGLGIARAMPPNDADQEILVGVPPFWDHLSSDGERILALRASGADTFYGVTNLGEVIKVVAGVRTSLGFGGLVGEGSGLGELHRLRIRGNEISYRHWYAQSNLSGTAQPEPSTWSLQVTDSDIAGPGDYLGVVYHKATASLTWSDAIEFVSVATGSDTAIRPRTLDERRRWADDGGENAAVLLELGVLAETTGSPTGTTTAFACVSTRPYVTGSGDVPPHTAFEDIVTDVGDFIRRMSDQLSGKGETSHGTIKLRNDNGALDRWNNYNWDGRVYRAWSGAQDWPFCDFTMAARGLIADIDWSEANALAVKMRDPGAFLANAQVLTERFTDTSPPSLPEATIGRLIPRPYGYVYNVTPVLVDAANSEYQVSRVPLIGIPDIREAGNSVLGAATLDLPNGKFRLGATAEGPITCDVVATYPVHAYNYAGSGTGSLDIQTLGGIAGAVAVEAGLDQDFIDFNNTEPELVKHSIARAANTLDAGYYGGLYLDSERTAADVLDEVALSHGCFWSFNREGRLIYGRFNLPASDPIFNLEDDDFESRSFMPVMRIVPHQLEMLYARRNWTIQDGQLAFAVSEEDAALYAAPGVLSTFAPTADPSHDTPDYHLLARAMKPRVTLLSGTDTAGARDYANVEAERLWTMFKQPIVVFQFKTRRYATELELGMVVNITSERWGFDAGQNGQIVSIRESLMKRVAVVQWATQIDGAFPLVDPTYPYLSAADFGL